MNTYTIYLVSTGEKIASGTAQECADILGLGQARKIWDMVSELKRTKYPKYRIVVHSAGKVPKPLDCPCDFCNMQPDGKPKDVVAWSCDDECVKQNRWVSNYWRALHKKYGKGTI